MKEFEQKVKKLQNEHILEVSTNEWNKAYKKLNDIQKISKNKIINFKISKKNKSSVELNHSFLYIESEKEKKSKLICLSEGGQYIGKGNFGTVRLAIDEDGNYFAVKVQEQSKKDEVYFEKELNRYHATVNTDSNKTYQVIDYLGKSLANVIESIKLSPLKKLQIAKGVLIALQELHHSNIIHCDINPGNILLNFNKKNIDIKIIDFGLSVKLKENENGRSLITLLNESSPGINFDYLAPEILSTSPDFMQESQKQIKIKKTIYYLGENPIFSTKSDIYSLGLILYNKLGIKNIPIIRSMSNNDPFDRPKCDEVLEAIEKEIIFQEKNTPSEIQENNANVIDSNLENEENFNLLSLSSKEDDNFSPLDLNLEEDDDFSNQSDDDYKEPHLGDEFVELIENVDINNKENLISFTKKLIQLHKSLNNKVLPEFIKFFDRIFYKEQTLLQYTNDGKKEIFRIRLIYECLFTYNDEMREWIYHKISQIRKVLSHGGIEIHGNDKETFERIINDFKMAENLQYKNDKFLTVVETFLNSNNCPKEILEESDTSTSLHRKTLVFSEEASSISSPEEITTPNTNLLDIEVPQKNETANKKNTTKNKDY